MHVNVSIAKKVDQPLAHLTDLEKKSSVSRHEKNVMYTGSRKTKRLAQNLEGSNSSQSIKYKYIIYITGRFL